MHGGVCVNLHAVPRAIKKRWELQGAHHMAHTWSSCQLDFYTSLDRVWSHSFYFTPCFTLSQCTVFLMIQLRGPHVYTARGAEYWQYETLKSTYHWHWQSLKSQFLFYLIFCTVTMYCIFNDPAQRAECLYTGSWTLTVWNIIWSQRIIDRVWIIFTFLLFLHLQPRRIWKNSWYKGDRLQHNQIRKELLKSLWHKLLKQKMDTKISVLNFQSSICQTRDFTPGQFQPRAFQSREEQKTTKDFHFKPGRFFWARKTTYNV